MWSLKFPKSYKIFFYFKSKYKQHLKLNSLITKQLLFCQLSQYITNSCCYDNEFGAYELFDILFVMSYLNYHRLIVDKYFQTKFRAVYVLQVNTILNFENLLMLIVQINFDNLIVFKQRSCEVLLINIHHVIHTIRSKHVMQRLLVDLFLFNQ